MKKDFENFFAGKRVTVMGLGLLGRGLNDVKFLSKYCAEVLVTDLKSEKDLEKSLSEVRDLSNVKFVLGEHRLEDFENRDFILKAAGVPQESIYIEHARQNNVPIYMDEALFAKLSPETKIVGVTGTRGKTTTTMMIYEILKSAGKHVLLGGNIRGLATLPLLENIEEDMVAVLELSSWQLQGFGDIGISPEVSVFTNFVDDHLNYYKNDRQAYFGDKALIYRNQKPSDTIIFGENIPDEFKKDILAARSKKMEVKASDVEEDFKLKIPGEHNKLNAWMAIKACEVLGVDAETAKNILKEFKGVEGRLELVRTFQGINFYNDTTATTPDATVNAIKALSNVLQVILIMGGADKGIDMSALIPVANSVKKIILLPGTGTDSIVGLGLINFEKVGSMPEAVLKARSLATSGDIILMSPAFASFGPPPGGFKNEFDRGEQFDAAVKNL